MKKIKLGGKLNKETIAKLNDEQMNGVKGGAWTSHVLCSNTGLKHECKSNSCKGIICFNL